MEETRAIKYRDTYRKYYEANKEAVLKKNAEWKTNHLDHFLWNQARQRSKKSGLEFNIEISDVIIPTHCPYLKVPIVSPSLDRIDNSKGYIKGNVEVISLKANRMKSNATFKELIDFSMHILENEQMLKGYTNE